MSGKFHHPDLNNDGFPWGPVTEVHRVGEYTIVEHVPEIFKNHTGTGTYDYTKTAYSVHLRGGSYEGAETPDKALLICIGHAHKTSGAVRYAAQILGLDESE